MSDYPILVDGRVVSANQHRQRERIERKLRELEAEVASIEFQIEQEQERGEDLRHMARMAELHKLLVTRASGPLVYKTTLNARRR
jgi:hypothetical protein